MKNKRILIIGDSTGYIVRPAGKKFHTFLLEAGYESTNLCDSAVIIDDLLKNLSIIVANDYDYIILPLGINDITPRVYNYKLFKFMNKKRTNLNRIQLYFQYINHAFNKYIAPIIIKLFKLYGVSKPDIYTKKLMKLIDLISNECSSNIIIFTISTTNQKMLSYLPNLNILIEQTNNLIRKNLLYKHVHLIDIDYIYNDFDRNLHLQDGFHYSETIHKVIFNMIDKIVDEKK